MNFSKFIEELKNVDAPAYLPYDEELRCEPEARIAMVGFFYLWKEHGTDLRKLHNAWYYKDGYEDNFKEGAYIVYVEMLPGEKRDEGFLFVGRRENGYVRELVNARVSVPTTLEEFEEEVETLSQKPVSVYS